PSSSAETSDFPVGPKATARTPVVCPRSRARCRQLAVSQSTTSLSRPAEASVLLSGLKWSEVTMPLRPPSVLGSLASLRLNSQTRSHPSSRSPPPATSILPSGENERVVAQSPGLERTVVPVPNRQSLTSPRSCAARSLPSGENANALTHSAPTPRV